jgi:hypothetical protein
MEPLLNDYDKQFQRITDLCNQAPRGLGGVFCTQEARRIRITQPRAFCITCSFSRG